MRWEETRHSKQSTYLERLTICPFTKVISKPNALHRYCKAQSKGTDQNHEIYSAFCDCACRIGIVQQREQILIE